MKSYNLLLTFVVYSLLLYQTPAFAGNNTIGQIVQSEATQKGVPEALVKAVIKAESSNNPFAVSPKGAMGLMQLMPKTAKRFQVTDAFDPQQNIRAGVTYLKLLKQQFGSWPLALAAYNAGEGKVEKYGGIPPYKETRNYVVKVLSQYDSSLIPASLKGTQPKNNLLIFTSKQKTLVAPKDIYSASIFFDVEG